MSTYELVDAGKLIIDHVYVWEFNITKDGELIMEALATTVEGVVIKEAPRIYRIKQTEPVLNAALFDNWSRMVLQAERDKETLSCDDMCTPVVKSLVQLELEKEGEDRIDEWRDEDSDTRNPQP